MRNRITAAAVLIHLAACAQIKPDTVVTARDTTITNYTVKVKSITYDTLKSIVVIPVVQSLYLRQNLRFEFTAENTDALTKLGMNLLNNWNSLGRCCPSYSITRSTDFARSGLYSTRYELHNNDADVASSKRAEAARASNDEPTLSERSYGMSYYLPGDYTIDPTPESVTQWQSTKGVSPPLALWTENGYWKIVVFGTTKRTLGLYTTKKWTDFVVHVKWSTGSDGLIEIWKDGVKLPSITGANTYSGYPGNYMKVGPYKWPWKKTDSYNSNTTKRVFYTDDVRIGNQFATYNDVKPGS